MSTSWNSDMEPPPLPPIAGSAGMNPATILDGNSLVAKKTLHTVNMQMNYEKRKSKYMYGWQQFFPETLILATE